MPPFRPFTAIRIPPARLRLAASAAPALFALGLLLLTRPAFGAAEVQLAWDDCGSFGSSVKSFACNSNSDAEVLVVSFVPPGGVTAFSALSFKIQIVAAPGDPVPDWWSFQTGACRAGSVSGLFSLPSTLGHCADALGLGSVGGVFASPNTAGEIEFVVARPSAVPLDSTLQYYAGGFSFDHSHSTGTGACAGCSVPLGIYVSRLFLDQNGAPDFEYTLSWRNSGHLAPYVTWQCEGQPQFDFEGFFDRWDFPGCATPAHRRSWGAIKSLYR